ncbi:MULTISPECIES: helix-turn-helix transcriptional regulator [unclassified Agrobacterium]|uniref:XRE family transcriptional regulator n=1 Tax=Agrobacterium fabrum TaxID=1176649 RepID=A0A2W5FES2_9HYPH|nr:MULTISPECIES: helix-turn-helix transcriptional regulator [unclassified Agrobacterium]PZP52170.1 MAG: XRE family transcriptional regulator [Agrobacterium fabrum]MDH0613896.1 helix-turn-helix domain-containing protein [Agrobacterium sp. GD03872]MDH0696785.1 helix-turn-helix domain-containing protein [Agrobacterium sp. GD03871]MDH1060051.1 helix-turn-helix domain-containing protein [Agrobacterium sp. GD03992]MDH2209964.1 helix-turn-helix domain-containing protein [Agrobacterium sp. GD03643]
MAQNAIDTLWFLQRLQEKGGNQSDLARFLGLDRSAVTRMLKGDRNMSADEQDRIADYLGIPVGEIALHRRGGAHGFSESGQAPYAGPASETSRQATSSPSGHPIFGCMKGTITVMPDVDLTEPMDFEWGEKLYNE